MHDGLIFGITLGLRLFADFANSTLILADTVLNLILRMPKKISILKNARFSGKGRQSLHIYVMRMLIYCVKLDHAM